MFCLFIILFSYKRKFKKSSNYDPGIHSGGTFPKDSTYTEDFFKPKIDDISYGSYPKWYFNDRNNIKKLEK